MQKLITKKLHNNKNLFTLLIAISLMQGVCAQDKAPSSADLIKNNSQLNNQPPKQQWEALNQASNIAFQQKDLAKANQLNKEALAYAQANFKENTLELANALHAVGMLYLACENYDEAALILKKSLNIREEKLPKNHLDIAATLLAISINDLHKKQDKSGINSYHQAKAIIESKKIVNHQTIDALYNIGESFINIKKFSIASVPLMQANLLQKKLSKNDKKMRAILAHLATIFMELKQSYDLDSVCMEWLALEKRQNNNHLTLANIESLLGQAKFKQGLLEASLEHYQNAIHSLQLEIQKKSNTTSFEALAPQSLKLGINELLGFYLKYNRKQYDALLKNVYITKLTETEPKELTADN